MIAAPNDLPVEGSFRKWYTSMRTVVFEGEWLSVRVPPKGDLFSQKFFCLQLPLPEFSSLQSEVPYIS
jgi:hypothetical protein